MVISSGVINLTKSQLRLIILVAVSITVNEYVAVDSVSSGGPPTHARERACLRARACTTHLSDNEYTFTDVTACALADAAVA